ENFQEQRGLRCGWRKDVTSSMSQTNHLNSYQIQKETHTLQKSIGAKSMAQTKLPDKDHQQKLSSTIVDAVIAQEKEGKAKTT
ncbi:Hypothetical protein CINCED_3A010724, partial [Cinara cedri]